MNTETVGIVVIGRNEGARLIGCLLSLGPDVARTVYVDSGSDDGSVADANQLGAAVVRLDMSIPFSPGRARNEGFLALATVFPGIRYVQFVDGDCEMVPGWLDEAVAFLEEHADVAVVCGRRRERYPDNSVYNLLCDIEWNSPIGEASACGGDALMRADAMRAVDGFNAELIAGEEPELCGRIRQRGWKIWRLDSEMTRHDADMMRFSQWWFRTVRSGYGFADISRRYLFSRQAEREKVEVRRAIFWAGVLPCVIAIAGFFWTPLLLASLIYPLQTARIAMRHGVWRRESWIYAPFMMLAKFAQLYGAVKYCYRALRRRRIELIEYKRA